MNAYQAVLTQPRSVAARRALARQWRALNDPRAELIEKQLEMHDRVVEFWTRSDDIFRLERTKGREWAGVVGAWARSFRYELGLVAEITIDATTFLEHAAEIVASAPIVHLLLEGSVDVARLAATPALAQMSTLSIATSLTDDEAAELARSPYVRRLRALELCNGAITTRGLEALACSENLRDIVFIELTGNPVDGELHRFDTKRIDGRYYFVTARGLYYLDVAMRAAAATYEPMDLTYWPPAIEELAYEE